jgi:methylglutaconyl-CoA hydratase
MVALQNGSLSPGSYNMTDMSSSARLAPCVRVDRGSSTWTLTLDVPERRNALGSEMLEALHAALDQIESDPGIRTLVLDAEGEVFCAGADLGAGSKRDSATIASSASLFLRLWELPVPVVAAVRGDAYGGGLGLVAAADIAIASRDASFGFTEVRLGVVPAVIAPYVLHRLDRRAASELFLTGATLDGAQAAEVGLVTRAVPRYEVDDHVALIVGELALGAPGALAVAKRLLRTLQPSGPAEGLDTLSAEMFAGEEAQEGIRAFVERRRPEWAPASETQGRPRPRRWSGR